MLDEPPGADPHAGWCGDWGLETPGYPIRSLIEKPAQHTFHHNYPIRIHLRIYTAHHFIYLMTLAYEFHLFPHAAKTFLVQITPLYRKDIYPRLYILVPLEHQLLVQASEDYCE